MAINVQYGPISSALGLAQTAGQNQGQQQRFGNFMDFARLTQQAQDEIDRRNANQIQASLAADSLRQNGTMAMDRLQAQQQQTQAQNDLARQSMAANNQFKNASLQLHDQALQNTNDYRETRANQFQQGLDQKTQASDEKNQAISNLPPEAQDVVRATGRMPYVPNNAGADPSSAREKLLNQEMQQYQKMLDKTAYDPNNLSKLGQQQSQKLPGAVAGQENTYQFASTRLPQIQQELAAIAQQRQQASLPTVAAASVKPQAASTPATGVQADKAPPAGPGSQAQPIPVQTADQYAQIPKFAYYSDPSGTIRQKP